VIGCEDRLRNDLYCVGWGIKLYSNQIPHQVIGVGRSVMENGELYGPRFLRPPRLATSCTAASARGTASVTGQTCSALHCALAMDNVMETELIARPNTNSGLHYMPDYMYRGRVSWIQILQLHVFFTERFETIGNYVYYRGHLGIQYGRYRKFKLMILLDTLTPKMWGYALKSLFCLP